MKKPLVFLLALGLAALPARAQGIRRAAVAGQFYEGSAARLSAQIEAFLAAAKPEKTPAGRVRALIVPHAGYVYSGSVAAFAYKLVQGSDFETVVIIGPTHRYGFEGCSIYPEGGFETPLGVAEVDKSIAQALIKASGFSFDPEAHKEEHSVEVQVPFVQKVFPKARIVPIVMGYPDEQTIRTMAGALAKVLMDKNALVIASTDMSHYLEKGKANALDADTMGLIQNLKTNSIMRKVGRNENVLCGGGPVLAALFYAQKLGEAKVGILKYADSAQTTGDASGVVGYMAAAVYSGKPLPEFTLSPEEKKGLLELARQAVEKFVRERKVVDFETTDPNFLAERGAFVTLTRGGRLRGCIGFIEPVYPLHLTVLRAAIYAATEDTRFNPVTAEELKDLSYEISVLTPTRKIDNPRLVQVGKHGLVIAKGNQRGLLLPQVAVENNWSREEFLAQACLKAGLEADAWKKGAEISVFEAIVFH
jgi:AmmeMemoRadiSam system protein B/AmmeMemoRadiSam system protein A